MRYPDLPCLRLSNTGSKLLGGPTHILVPIRADQSIRPEIPTYIGCDYLAAYVLPG